MKAYIPLAISLLAGCTYQQRNITQPKEVHPIQNTQHEHYQLLEDAVGEEAITEVHLGSKNEFVVVMLDRHKDLRCQRRLYSTLETLLPHTRFVAQEGNYGDFTHPNITDMSKDDSIPELVTEDLSTRRKKVKKIYSRKGVEKEPFDNEEIFHSVRLLEVVYQEQVNVFGIDDPLLHEQTGRIQRKINGYEYQYLAMQYETVTRELQDNMRALLKKKKEAEREYFVHGIVERSKMFVTYLHKESEKHSQEDTVIPLVIGPLHEHSARDYLYQNDISYAIVAFPECQLNDVEQEKLEKWEDEFWINIQGL